MKAMTETTVTHGTFTIEKTYKAAPTKVFAAFADAATKRRWFAEGKGWEVDSYNLDFRVGGSERTLFRFMGGPDLPEGAPPSGTPMSNDTTYLDIVNDRRIVYAYSMTINDTPFSASLTTIELRPNGSGTKLSLTEQGAFFENGDDVSLREQGTRELLDQLAEELARES